MRRQCRPGDQVAHNVSRSRSRKTKLRRREHPRYGGITHIQRLPANPERFTCRFAPASFLAIGRTVTEIAETRGGWLSSHSYAAPPRELGHERKASPSAFQEYGAANTAQTAEASDEDEADEAASRTCSIALRTGAASQPDTTAAPAPYFPHPSLPPSSSDYGQRVLTQDYQSS